MREPRADPVGRDQQIGDRTPGNLRARDGAQRTRANFARLGHPLDCGRSATPMAPNAGLTLPM